VLDCNLVFVIKGSFGQLKYLSDNSNTLGASYKGESNQKKCVKRDNIYAMEKCVNSVLVWKVFSVF